MNILDKKKKKEESKIPVRDLKEKSGDEEKKKEKPKAHAPSHTKIRSIGNFTLISSDIACPECQIWKVPNPIFHILCWVGLEMDTPHPAPAKKAPSAPQLGDKYNIKPPLLKRPRYYTFCLLGSMAYSCSTFKP